jgi:hypothetical protein
VLYTQSPPEAATAQVKCWGVGLELLFDSKNGLDLAPQCLGLDSRTVSSEYALLSVLQHMWGITDDIDQHCRS